MEIFIKNKKFIEEACGESCVVSISNTLRMTGDFSNIPWPKGIDYNWYLNLGRDFLYVDLNPNSQWVKEVLILLSNNETYKRGYNRILRLCQKCVKEHVEYLKTEED